MANNLSAKKRIKIARRNCIQNKYYKTSVRNLIKLFFKELQSYKVSFKREEKDELQKKLNLIYSLLDKGTKRNVFHKNFASKKKAKLISCLKML